MLWSSGALPSTSLVTLGVACASQVAAVVTQPPSSRGRGRKLRELIPSPEGFLEALAALEPDVCVTAAYGNVLPLKFLAIPKRGTVNIHPSLLPLYRGASPVQRALQDGMAETGVSVAFTVRAMDAGPIIASERVAVDLHVKVGPSHTRASWSSSSCLLLYPPSLCSGGLFGVSGSRLSKLDAYLPSSPSIPQGAATQREGLPQNLRGGMRTESASPNCDGL
eukprot:jgi/Mesen1/10826/ME000093S10343